MNWLLTAVRLEVARYVIGGPERELDRGRLLCLTKSYWIVSCVELEMPQRAGAGGNVMKPT